MCEPFDRVVKLDVDTWHTVMLRLRLASGDRATFEREVSVELGRGKDREPMLESVWMIDEANEGHDVHDDLTVEQRDHLLRAQVDRWRAAGVRS